MNVITARGRVTKAGTSAVPMHDNRIASVGALKPVIRRHPPGGVQQKTLMVPNRRRNTEILPRPEGGWGNTGAPRCRYAQAVSGF